MIFAAAKAAGELFARLRQPAMVGEILVGVVMGPHALGWFHVNQGTITLSQLGIVVLLFTAGLETRLSDLLAVGRSSLAASVGGMALTGGGAFGVAQAFGASPRASILIAVALAASSVGIAARVFAELGAVGSRPARVVLGAAVVDDVVVLAALPLVQGAGRGSSWAAVLLGVAGAIGFMVLISVVGSRLARRHPTVLERPRTRRGPFVLALVLCLGLAVLARQVGLAALVGAFLAGMVLAETRERYGLERQMEPLFDLLVPFFFVVSAARVDPGAIPTAGAGFLAALAVVAVAGKLVGCGLGAAGLSARERLTVGSGMLPRGEVALVVAAAGLASGALSPSEFAALVATVLVSTLVAPPAIAALAPSDRPKPGDHRRAIPPEAFRTGDAGGPEEE